MEVVTFMDYRQQSDGDVVWRMVLSTLLISITTLVIAVCTSWRLYQQQMKPQRRDQSTQTTNTHREIGTTRVREVDGDISIHKAEGTTPRGIAGQLREPSHSRDSTHIAKFAVKTEVSTTMRSSSKRRSE
eukprot:6491037-Amphidinium_carterae.1